MIPHFDFPNLQRQREEGEISSRASPPGQLTVIVTVRGEARAATNEALARIDFAAFDPAAVRVRERRKNWL
jgi:hypothetical protein